MVSITVPLEDELKREVDRFAWVNWSEVARECLMRRVLFEKFIHTGKLTRDEQHYCEEHDWHPVDELPLNEEFIRELRTEEKLSKAMTPEEFLELSEKL